MNIYFKSDYLSKGYELIKNYNDNFLKDLKNINNSIINDSSSEQKILDSLLKEKYPFINDYLSKIQKLNNSDFAFFNTYLTFLDKEDSINNLLFDRCSIYINQLIEKKLITSFEDTLNIIHP